MDDDLKKIKKLVSLMRKQGVLSLKLPELELELSPDSIIDKPPTQRKTESALESPINIEPEYSMDDMINWNNLSGILVGQEGVKS